MKKGLILLYLFFIFLGSTAPCGSSHYHHKGGLHARTHARTRTSQENEQLVEVQHTWQRLCISPKGHQRAGRISLLGD